MKGFQITSEGSLNPWVDLLRTTDVLNNTPANALQAELPKVLDVDNVLTVLALGNSLLWLDSYVGVACHNFYVYHDEWHDRLHVIPWDMNSCLGSYNDFLTVPLETLTPYYSDDRIGNIRPLMTKLAALRAEIAATAFTGFTVPETHRLVEQLETIKDNVRDALQSANGATRTKERRYG